MARTSPLRAASAASWRARPGARRDAPIGSSGSPAAVATTTSSLHGERTAWIDGTTGAAMFVDDAACDIIFAADKGAEIGVATHWAPAQRTGDASVAASRFMRGSALSTTQFCRLRLSGLHDAAYGITSQAAIAATRTTNALRARGSGSSLAASVGGYRLGGGMTLRLRGGTPLPAGWLLQCTADGRPFYYHPASGTSQWHLPDPPPSPAAVQRQLHIPSVAEVQSAPMADVQVAHLDAGRLYAVAGDTSFGIHREWQTHFQQQPFFKVEFNLRSSHIDKRMNGAQARTRALAWLAQQQLSGPHRAALDAALDTERIQAARAQQERDEQTRRQECERRAAAEQRAAEQRERERLEAKAAARRLAEAAMADSVVANFIGTIVAVEINAAVATVAAEVAAKAVAAAADAARRAELAARMRTAAINIASSHVAAAACAAVVARYPRRDQPKGARSAEAKRRRRQKRSAKSVAASQAASQPPSAPHHSSAANNSSTAGTSDQQQIQQLRRELARTQSLVRLERKRGKRQAKTALLRGKQAERRNGKAAARKRKRAASHSAHSAERKEAERARKRKLPVGEPLHSGELKHRRLLNSGDGRDRPHPTRSTTSPATTSCPRSKPHGVDPSPRLTFAD
jgi:hypothetical protein